jgi:hypothetical protein
MRICDLRREAKASYGVGALGAFTFDGEAAILVDYLDYH